MHSCLWVCIVIPPLGSPAGMKDAHTHTNAFQLMQVSVLCRKRAPCASTLCKASLSTALRSPNNFFDIGLKYYPSKWKNSMTFVTTKLYFPKHHPSIRWVDWLYTKHSKWILIMLKWCFEVRVIRIMFAIQGLFWTPGHKSCCYGRLCIHNDSAPSSSKLFLPIGP